MVIVLVFLGSANSALAEENNENAIPTRYGLAAILGHTFDPPDGIFFTQLSGFIMWDYDKVWRHWAPDPLRWKLEANAGLTVAPNRRAMISLAMMAVYYLEFISNDRLMPYIEGGIGVTYTDFQVEGQGLRVNFIPQLGIGMEFNVNSGAPFFSALRISHVSNGGLHDENRGTNSVLLMLGRFF